MSFTLHVEHQLTGGEVILEEFEGVSSFNNPPMTSTLRLTFADGRETETLDYGNVVKATTETND
jgi:hypothetical protein